MRNSLQSCAASVLLCAMTSAGRCTASIVAAIVIVLPVPVAPSSVSAAVARLDALGERGDRLRLVGGRREDGVELEGRHRGPSNVASRVGRSSVARHGDQGSHLSEHLDPRRPPVLEGAEGRPGRRHALRACQGAAACAAGATNVKEHTGQRKLPALELEDGTLDPRGVQGPRHADSGWRVLCSPLGRLSTASRSSRLPARRAGCRRRAPRS